MKLRSTLVALALVAGAGIAEAQSAPAQQTPRAERADSARRDGKHNGRRLGARGARGEHGGAALRGIQLTDAQRTQVRAIHDKYRTQYRALRDQLRAPMDSARAARQRGDSAAARAALARTTPVRDQMKALADRERAEIHGVLTAEQQRTFDANAQRMQERMTKQREGKGHGRGRRNG